MKSKHLVDPEIVAALEWFPSVTFANDALPGIRAGIAEQLANQAQASFDGVIEEELTVPGPVGGPPVRVLAYRPATRQGPLPALLHIHAGGFVVGSPEMMAPVNRSLAADLGCVIYSIDYRLAPEHKYPAAIEDCYAVLRWVNVNSDALGIDVRRIGIKGESAGGGLTAALALLARDRGEFSIAFQHMIYPMLDDRTVRDQERPFVGEFIWTSEQNRFGWASLLEQDPGCDGVPEYAAPARATELGGLPPAFVSAGALDLLMDENVAYAIRLLHAGIPVELHVYPGAYHGFDMVPEARITLAAGRDSREALRRAMHGQPNP